jgi:hypothetical protein
VADIDTALKQLVLDLAHRKLIRDLHHHRQADDLGETVEIGKGYFIHQGYGMAYSALSRFALTLPRQ